MLESQDINDSTLEVSGQRDEEIEAGKLAIYVFYPQGMGSSRLRIAAAEIGTARNINTINKLVELASP